LEPLEAHFDKVGAVCFSPDGKSLATADASYRRLIVWDLAARKPRVGQDWDKLPAAPAAVVFAPDGRHLAVGNSDGTIDVLRLAEAPVD
jgi:WD40 repeat protein